MKYAGRFGLAFWIALAVAGLQACTPIVAGNANSPARIQTSMAQGRGLQPYGSAPPPIPHLDTGRLGDAELGRQMTSYFHGNRLPLVGANVYTDASARRQVVLYGYVATEFGKNDAAQKASQLLNDPKIAIVNRIAVQPDLLGMKSSAPARQERPADGSSSGTEPWASLGSAQSYEQYQSGPGYQAYQGQGYPGYQSYQGSPYQQSPDPMSMLMPLLMNGMGFSSGGGVSGFSAFGYPGPFGSPLANPYSGYPSPYGPFGP